MYNFREGLYTDVRIEETFETRISYKKRELEEQKIRNNKGAFIRVFDGDRWYYSATTNLDNIQTEIDDLSNMATVNMAINDHPIVKNFEVHNQKSIQFDKAPIENISIEEKVQVLKTCFDLFENDYIVEYASQYVDNKTIKAFYSSKGASLKYDRQTCGIRVSFEMVSGEKKFRDSVAKAFVDFKDVKTILPYMEEEVSKSVDFLLNAENIEPGDYTVVLSPMATGVFTHESFGHKSESDFMVGDETMAKEWMLGKSVASDLVTIIDDGNEPGSGFVQYDDEGTISKKTMIITDGILTGRLHSTETATILEEELTGNARALNFEYEPLVRMTTTYIDKGDRPKDEIISEIEKGIYVDTIRHGSGMTTFTIAPSRAYKIENGRITEPVKISVVTGNVFETLDEVDAVSQEFELLSFVGGGCGKMEQMNLPVGFGGPYIRVKKLNVQ